MIKLKNFFLTNNTSSEEMKSSTSLTLDASNKIYTQGMNYDFEYWFKEEKFAE